MIFFLASSLEAKAPGHMMNEIVWKFFFFCDITKIPMYMLIFKSWVVGSSLW